MQEHDAAHVNLGPRCELQLGWRPGLYPRTGGRRLSTRVAETELRCIGRPGEQRTPPGERGGTVERASAVSVFASQAAVVTRAAVGIGKSVALELMGRGAAVWLLDLQGEVLEQVAAEARRAEGQVVFVNSSLGR